MLRSTTCALGMDDAAETMRLFAIVIVVMDYLFVNTNAMAHAVEITFSSMW